jgi:D-amino-acid dehydrogenase
MLDPESPLLVRPRLEPAFARWCFAFARNCRADRFAAGTRSLLALNDGTLAGFDALRSDGIDFEMHSDGLLLAAVSEQELDHEWKVLSEVRELGYAGTLDLLNRADVHRLEPALTSEVVGGIYAIDERHVRPESLTAGLAQYLRAHRAEVREGVAATRIVPTGRGWSIETRSGESASADRVIVAAGVWTRQLLAQLGTRIPLEGAKGYSITSPTTAPPSLRHAVMLHEAKVGCSPFSNAFRLAGTLELAGDNLALDRRRLDAIAAAARRYLGLALPTGWVEWAGMRPLLPDGLPAIGRVPTADGVFVATGHAMLGVTLAAATADALAPLVLEDTEPELLRPFRADRDY